MDSKHISRAGPASMTSDGHQNLKQDLLFLSRMSITLPASCRTVEIEIWGHTALDPRVRTLSYMLQHRDNDGKPRPNGEVQTPRRLAGDSDELARKVCRTTTQED